MAAPPMPVAPSITDPALAAIASQAAAEAVATVQAQMGGIVTLLNALYGAKVYLTCAVALVAWEWLATFKMEYERFWKRKMGAVTVVFLFLRYWTLFTMTMYMILFFYYWTGPKCNQAHWLEPVLGIPLLLAIQFLAGARVFAIYEQSKLVLVFLSAISIAGVVLQAWAIHPNTYLQLPPYVIGCIDAPVASNEDSYWVYWLAPLIYDSAIVFLTAFRILQLWREGGSLPFLKVMLRDGILYFGLIFAFNVLNVVWFRSDATVKALHGPFSVAFASVMICRLCLNLRAPDVMTFTKTQATQDLSDSYGLSDRTPSSNQSNPFTFGRNPFSLDKSIDEKDANRDREESFYAA